MDSLIVLPLPPADLLAGIYPRGPGLFFSLPKLLTIFAVFAAWAKTTAWMDQDSERFDLPREIFNLFMILSGFAGLLLAFIIPIFGIGLFVLVTLFLAPVGSYIYLRNQQASADDKLFSPAHFRRMLKQMGMPVEEEEVEDNEKLPPIRFVGKAIGDRSVDPARVNRAMKSKGYKAALKMIAQAIKRRATDIHMEPTRDEMSIRFRIDSIMHAIEPLDRTTGESVLNIFKVLANLDITEKRKPQDGSFSAEVADNGVDFRVATAGSVIGEKMVMRILDTSQAMTDLTRIGLRESAIGEVREVVGLPHGLFLSCGPTGAGKSSTLYAALGEIDRYQRNVITLENPVEYQLHNITQIEVNPKAGKTFATELRSILRQDPDVIMIGEIRDEETAEIACQAAQTGHMVLSTLHANDTITAIGRLIDLKVPPFLLANALTAVLGQRLVRLVCPKCRVKVPPPDDFLRELHKRCRIAPEKVRSICRPPTPQERPKDADGEVEECPSCGNTGYRGRTGIFELLVLTDEMRELIRSNPNLMEIKKLAIKGGLTSLMDDGLRKVAEGKTTLAEIQRVAK